MSFQFQCPHGHLLEGEPAQAGQQCNCPLCGVLFIIPQPIAAPEPPGSAAPAYETPAPAPEPPAVFFAPADSPSAGLLHIPCPKGHELEVPREMLNQFVECPHCQAQFHLRERDSVEYRRKDAAEQERRWDRAGQTWLQWAIIFAVLVVLGLISLIAFT